MSRPYLAGLEAEAGGSGEEEQAGVEPGAPPPVLAGMASEGEGAALRRTFPQVTSGQVTKLGRLWRHGKGGQQTVQLEVVGPGVGDRRALPDQSRRRHLQLPEAVKAKGWVLGGHPEPLGRRRLGCW